MKAQTGSFKKLFTWLTLLGVAWTGSLLYSCGKNGGASQGSNNSSALVNYTGTFVNSSEPDSSKASGTVMATFNTSTLELDYTISWKSLTSEPEQMHFHDDGPVIVKITGFPVSQSGTYTGTAVLTSAQAVDLVNGNIYAMIHTQDYTAGEIKATLVKQ
jgi:hypothetical protein